ncbi:hypothetical protein ASPZODRAFT_136498 [Penicilliopsis zonata CBS 506.65]|uniref:Riboflavin kinase n=1 Tax=Penicilliopsis zonata CBS 506.65 TaxID=1073090 RepID=A0A1L9S802_9EURO|nr:hypothetical protein ASPZODRAFT_136498 [Penicilliopsis zonata CBS 506.65]OJJ43281.1 hypothetical protein ASPZODRAFT_136498 [Penicilliopsis zonata CBS 506.65]
MRPDTPRAPIAGPDTGPASPFPIRLSGPVIKGFGRGSKELGIPTANIPPDGLDAYPSLESGVYYGVVALDPTRFVYDLAAEKAHTVDPAKEEAEQQTQQQSDSSAGAVATILPAVLSIGYNPFYKNTVRSVEIHIMPPLSSPSPTAAVPPGDDDNNNNNNNKQHRRPSFCKLPDFYSTQLNLLILGYIRPEYDYVSLEALVEDIRVDCEVARQSLRREAYAVYLEGGLASSALATGEVVQDKRWLTAFSATSLL